MKYYPIDSKEGREAFTRGGWDKIPDSEWIEALEASKKYKIPERFINWNLRLKEQDSKKDKPMQKPVKQHFWIKVRFGFIKQSM